MVQPLRLDAWWGDQTVQGYAVNILDLFFALRPENRPVVLDSEYIPRMKELTNPSRGYMGRRLIPALGTSAGRLPSQAANVVRKGRDSSERRHFELPSGWKIGDPF